MICLNGPDLSNSQSVVKEAMINLWSQSKRVNLRHGHFVRTSSNIKTWMVSKAVDTVRESRKHHS